MLTKDKIFQGEMGYPALSESELIEFIIARYNKNVKIFNTYTPLNGKLIQVSIETCFIHEEVNGGFEDEENGITNYNIYLFDLTALNLKNFFNNNNRNYYHQEDPLHIIESFSSGHIKINLSLLTDLSYNRFQWRAVLNKSRERRGYGLFKELLTYIYQEFMDKGESFLQ